MKPVKVRGAESDYMVNEALTLSQIRSIAGGGRDRKFFIRFGDDQKEIAYRGCVISSFTSTYSDNSKKRQNVPYLFCAKEGRFSCLSTGDLTLRQAKKVIAEVLSSGNGSMRSFNIFGDMNPVESI